MLKICVAGLWHLGCVTAACLAERHEVVGWDPDSEVVKKLSMGSAPILEPGLNEAIRGAIKAGHLRFSEDIASSISGADVVYVAFDTPVDEQDQADLSPINSAFDKILPHMKEGALVIISSQIPIGTSRKMLEKARSAKKGAPLCYVPENLRLGSALAGFAKPDRLVIGMSSPEAQSRLEEVFTGVEGERIYMDLESAEMAKHATNSYLAILISFSGEISDLCERSGANAGLVMKALLCDRRVSPYAPLAPGLGFGGGTLARDVQALRRAGAQKGVRTLVLDAAFEANRERMGYVQKKLRSALGSLEGKSIAFFGLTYKPGTDTLRRSLALEIISSLEAAGCRTRAYDPTVKGRLEDHPSLEICGSAQEAAEGADAIVITTGWEEFKGLDYGAICAGMRSSVIIDARNILDPRSLGGKARYYGVGVGNGKGI